jgi:hypothetical protein
MTVDKAGAFVDQPIQVGRIHIGKAQSPDRIKTLLVGDDENDMGS